MIVSVSSRQTKVRESANCTIVGTLKIVCIASSQHKPVHEDLIAIFRPEKDTEAQSYSCYLVQAGATGDMNSKMLSKWKCANCFIDFIPSIPSALSPDVSLHKPALCQNSTAWNKHPLTPAARKPTGKSQNSASLLQTLNCILLLPVCLHFDAQAMQTHFWSKTQTYLGSTGNKTPSQHN